MIQQLRFDGYRLLDGFVADLDRLTVVIGANASGKSTLLDALSVVAQGVDWSLNDVIASKNGMWSLCSIARECDEIGWQIRFSKPMDHMLFSKMPIGSDLPCVYEARIGRDQQGQVEPRYECLRYATPRQGYSEPFKMLEVDYQRAKVFDPKTGKLTPFDQPEPKAISDSGESLSKALNSPVRKAALVLSQMRFENQFPIPTWVRAFFSTFCFYPGFDVSRSSPIRSKPAEFRAHTTLLTSGENLGTVLHEIQTRHDHRGAASELHDFFVAAYPHVERITAETAFGGEPRVLVRVRESGLHRGTELWELSDGMLRFLLLCTALLNPVAPPFIALDEPEAGLHPRLLPIVASMIRAAAEKTQVLVTTHSPQLLNSLKLSEIAVMTRENSTAKWFRPGSRTSLQKMLDSNLGGTLGDLHTSGELEAIA